MSGLRVLGRLDRGFAWRRGEGLVRDPWRLPLGRLRELRGGFAWAATRSDGRGEERHRLVRDPLGMGKLFWARGEDGQLLAAARPWRLVEAGCPLERVRAVPPGTAVEAASAAEPWGVPAPRETARWDPPGRRDPPDGEAAAGPSPGAVAGRIRATLDAFLADVSAEAGDRPVYVCLSGGLDSTGVAALARRHFGDVVAVSFDLDRPSGRSSEDREAARRVTREMGLPLLEVTVPPGRLLEPLDTVLREGVDWRGFNVHAGLVNAWLALGVAADAAGRTERDGARPLVLTGELANEFLADYRPETYRGETHYRLPRLGTDRLRRALVRGIATCHRETGVFEALGIRCVQPYAVAADAFLEIPAAYLERSGAKRELARGIFGEGVPDFVCARSKVRAQVGDDRVGRGVLGHCLDRGIDADHLRRRFAEIHDVSDPGQLDHFIRGGRYAASLPWTRDEEVRLVEG